MRKISKTLKLLCPILVTLCVGDALAGNLAVLRSAIKNASEEANISEIDSIVRDGKFSDEELSKMLMITLSAINIHMRQEISEILLKYGANANYKDKNGSTPLIQIVLLEDDTNIHERTAIAELLVKKGAKIDQRDNSGSSAIDYARQLDWDLAELLRSKMEYKKIGEKEKREEEEKKEGELYEMGEVEKEQFDNAIKEGDIDTINRLTKKNISKEDLWDALKTAALCKQKEVVELLIKKGADINFCDSMGTILYIAASSGDVDAVELLLEQGADPNIRSNDFGYPLMAIAANSNMFGRRAIYIAELLLDNEKNPANIELKDRKGRTALDIAKKATDAEEMVKFLEEWIKKNPVRQQ